MRLPTNLPLFGRNLPIRPTLLSLAHARNGSRLSGIHEGLRRSERARPQGASPKKEIRLASDQNSYLSPAERLRARALARQNRITYKIRKGKKDITESSGPPRKSRIARLSDPQDPLGRDSPLKKFRTGRFLDDLKKKLKRDESRDGTLQHDDFQKQMLMGEVEQLLDSRKAPGKKGRTKPWQHDRQDGRPQRREAEEESFRAYGRGERDTERPIGVKTYGGDRSRQLWPENERSYDVPSYGLERHERERHERGQARNEGSFGRDRRDREAPRAERSFGRDRRDREAPRDERSFGRDRRDRVAPRDERSFGRDRRDREAPRAERSFGRDRRDREAPRDERSFGGQRRERERAREEDWFERRPSNHDNEKPYEKSRTDTRRTGVTEDGEGDKAKEKKPKKVWEPPISLPYTTAASQFLYGTSTVQAALEASRRKLYKLYVYNGENRRNHDKDEFLTQLARRRNVKVELLGEDGLATMNKMSGGRPHNGYVLEASPLPQMPIRALGEVSSQESQPGFRISIGHQSSEDAAVNGSSEFVFTGPGEYKPLVLYVDQVLDPGNLGAILRTASFMGVSAVAVSKRGSAPVTPVVLKASAGAAETLTTFSVDSPVDFVKESKENGWKVYAAVAPKLDLMRTQLDVRDVEKTDPLLRHPCLLVMGNEGEGLSRQLRRASDFDVSIPNMSGSKVVDSLNVSVATGLLCSAFCRGKSQKLPSRVEDAGALF